LKKRQQSAQQFNRRGMGRRRFTPAEPSRDHVHGGPLTESGMPAATPNAPPTSATVFTTDESRARFPWLPQRVITGSIWRGPAHERVKVDANGNATPWPPTRP